MWNNYLLSLRPPQPYNLRTEVTCIQWTNKMVTKIYELTIQIHAMTQLRSTDQNHEHNNRINYSKIIKQKNKWKRIQNLCWLWCHTRERKREREKKSENILNNNLISLQVIKFDLHRSAKLNNKFKAKEGHAKGR